jgi:hypothetical protein
MNSNSLPWLGHSATRLYDLLLEAILQWMQYGEQHLSKFFPNDPKVSQGFAILPGYTYSWRYRSSMEGRHLLLSHVLVPEQQQQQQQ